MSHRSGSDFCCHRRNAFNRAGKLTPIEDVVKIEFPKDGYRFTLADAAKGIKLSDTIRINQDLPGVIARRPRQIIGQGAEMRTRQQLRAKKRAAGSVALPYGF